MQDGSRNVRLRARAPIAMRIEFTVLSAMCSARGHVAMTRVRAPSASCTRCLVCIRHARGRTRRRAPERKGCLHGRASEVLLSRVGRGARGFGSRCCAVSVRDVARRCAQSRRFESHATARNRGRFRAGSRESFCARGARLGRGMRGLIPPLPCFLARAGAQDGGACRRRSTFPRPRGGKTAGLGRQNGVQGDEVVLHYVLRFLLVLTAPPH